METKNNTDCYQNAERSYLGDLTNGELQGDNVAQYLVDCVYSKMIEKHEGRLSTRTQKLIKSVKKCFDEEIKMFKHTLKQMDRRLNKLEKNLASDCAEIKMPKVKFSFNENEPTERLMDKIELPKTKKTPSRTLELQG